MKVYIVTNEFDLTPLNQTLQVGDTIGRLDGTVLTTINSVEYDNDAFYDWIGSADSLNYLSFTGTIPDPPVGGSVPTTPVVAPATPTSAGNQGTWATDGVYLYWCVDQDAWVRWVIVTSW